MDDITVLDGGMGQELIARTAATPTTLWSADVMDRDPEVVVDVHRSYIDAGAEVITVNAYSATRCRLAPHGREGDYERLQRLSVELAHRARGDRDDIRIAGCLSPYAWSYRPELALGFDELVPRYTETAGLQAGVAGGVDLFLCETMGGAHEAAAAAVGAASTGTPVWVSWSLADDASGNLRSGESITDAVAVLVDRLDGVVPAALLVNCSLPESISAAVPSLLAAGSELGVPVGAYANGFGAVDPDYDTDSTVELLGRRDDLDPAGYLAWVRDWVDAGLTLVGGCCEIGPAHIAAIANEV